MSSSQKRPHSPETRGKQKRCRRNAVDQPRKWRSCGAKDQRISRFKELRYKNHYIAVADLAPSQMSTVVNMQEVTDAVCTRVGSQQHRPSRSPSSHSLPDNGDLTASNNDDLMSMNTTNTQKPGSSPPLCASSRLLRNNHTALCQTYHLDAIHSPWETRRNNQARQWKAVVIPQIIPAFLKNWAATESGRCSPSPQSRMGCQCTTTALEVDCVTWDHTFLFCPCGHQLTFLRRMLLDCIINL